MHHEKQILSLAGDNKRGLIKTRVVLKNKGEAKVTGITEGNAEGPHRHINCMEIVKGQAFTTARRTNCICYCY